MTLCHRPHARPTNSHPHRLYPRRRMLAWASIILVAPIQSITHALGHISLHAQSNVAQSNVALSGNFNERCALGQP